jgi:hypothetical protein
MSFEDPTAERKEGQAPTAAETSAERENALEAYEKAQAKAETFLKDIDPDLSATAEKREVQLDNGQKFMGWVLAFKHSRDPDIEWTMDIGKDPDYLDTRFESVVRNIYAERGQEQAAVRDAAGYEDVDFGDQRFEELEGKEREQTNEERQLVDQANIMTNLVRQRFGLPGIVVPYEAVHVIKKDEWQGRGNALYNEGKKAIAVKETERNLSFKKKVVHEMLHAKIGNILPGPLKEGLVESLTKRLMKRYGEDPVTSSDSRDSRKLQSAFGNERTENGERLFGDDTFLAYVGEDGRLHSDNFTYGAERKMLETLTEKMAERSGGKFASGEEAFDALTKADVMGDREALRVIDECLGEGVLTRMYEIGDDVETLEKYVASL